MSRRIAFTGLPWFQFRLRTLLAAMSLAGLLLAWWFQPFVVQQHYKNGEPRTRFTLRRDWQGRRVAHGTQTWYLPDGSKIERTNFGEPITNDDFTTLLTAGPNPDFDYLIWLITSTVEPATWDQPVGSGRININEPWLFIPSEELP